jgi:hypothetical protein
MQTGKVFTTAWTKQCFGAPVEDVRARARARHCGTAAAKRGPRGAVRGRELEPLLPAYIAKTPAAQF